MSLLESVVMKKKSVLIIEDEMIHGIMLKSTIENNGYRVIDIIPRGEDAVIAALSHKPDLIISDILLKGSISGIDAAELILNHINIPFIFLTAYNDSSILKRASEASSSAIIHKPYDMKILIEALNTILK